MKSNQVSLSIKNPPFFHTSVCTVSDVSCARNLIDSLIKVKSLDKETLCLCLAAGIKLQRGPD